MSTWSKIGFAFVTSMAGMCVFFAVLFIWVGVAHWLAHLGLPLPVAFILPIFASLFGVCFWFFYKTAGEPI